MEVIRGKVKIPKDYFNRAAKKEYVFWARALVREFLQNSIDAGSSTVRFKFSKDRLSLVVQDDGCGMDKDIILTKLLALGGSHKQEGAVGGFGKAKEILFFAWSSYAIHTKNWLVEGEGPEYSIKTVDYYFNGTRCVIKFYDEQEFNGVLSAALEYLPRNEVKADVYLNGVKVLYALGEKKKVKQFEWGTVYTTPISPNGISIRVNGLEMFKQYSTGSLKNQVIVELRGYSTDVLTSNRDGLNYKYSSQLLEFMGDLSINPLSAILSFDVDVQEVISGNRLQIPESLLLMWNGDNPLTPIGGGMQGAWINKSGFQFSNFSYEFVIRRSKSYNIEKIKQFMEDPIAEPLAKMWASLLLEVVIANQISTRALKPGFVFNEKARGICMDKPEYPTLLINPLSEDLISANNIGQLKEVMEDIAYHEIAHIYNRKHDEIFVILSERIRSNHRKWKRQGFSTRVLNWKKLLNVGGEDGIK